MDKNSIERLLEACETSIESFGYETIVAEGNKEDIIKLIKGNKNYIVLEINVEKKLSAKNTLVIKLNSSDRERYKESINNAARIKSAMSNSSTKVSIQADDRQMVNQDIGDLFLRFEISNQNTLEEAQNMIVSAAYALTLQSSGN